MPHAHFLLGMKTIPSPTPAPDIHIAQERPCSTITSESTRHTLCQSEFHRHICSTHCARHHQHHAATHTVSSRSGQPCTSGAEKRQARLCCCLHQHTIPPHTVPRSVPSHLAQLKNLSLSIDPRTKWEIGRCTADPLGCRNCLPCIQTTSSSIVQ